MALNQIIGQPVSFNDPSCNDYCMPLVTAQSCGDYIDNPNFRGVPMNDWTITTGTNSLEGIIVSDGAGDVSLNQAITLDAGTYYVFYRFAKVAGNTTFDLTITNGYGAQVFDTSAGDDMAGVLSFTATGGSSRTVTLDFVTNPVSGLVQFSTFFICDADAFIPATDFTFQMPLFDTGANLLSGSTVSFDNNNDVHTGAPAGGYPATTAACGTLDTTVFNAVGNATTIGEDGYYFFKWVLGSVSITWAESPLVAPEYLDGEFSKKMMLKYSVDANTEYIRFDANTISGGKKSANEMTMTSGNSLLNDLVANYEDDNGTCRLVYAIEDITTDFTKMFQEDTFTATSDTKYRLKFKTTNATGCTVKIYDSASVLIFQATSDGVMFDKIFDTGTLPTATVTVRYELDEFVDFSPSAYYTDVLTEVSMIEQCSYIATINPLGEATIATLDTTHDTTTEEASTVSYNQNIEYSLDVNTLSIPQCYELLATNSCDATNSYISNCFEVCGANCSVGIKQIAWNPANVKCVGDNILDYENYTGNPWVWVKADLQDLDIEREVESYVRSDSFINIPWSRSRNFYTLQIWPIPRYMRVALASAFQDTFTIDGEEYQVVDEDAISVLFNARYENPIRIVVHKVGEFITSRNV